MQYSMQLVESIIIPEDRLRPDIVEKTVSDLASSIPLIGLQIPISVRFEENDEDCTYPILVAGLNRLEAHKRLGMSEINCVILRWSGVFGQFGGRDKLGSDFAHAANLGISVSSIAS
jgi:hypothetical protein